MFGRALLALLLAVCSAPVSDTVAEPSAASTAAATLAGVTRVTPSPAQPAARPWSARTPAEVLANLPGDASFLGAMAHLSSGVDPDPRAVGRTPTLGIPIYVRGLRPDDANEYIVPVEVDHTTIALMKIGLDRNGLGLLDAVRGWSFPSYPATSETAAIARGSAIDDPVTKAEFVWTTMRGSADELQPFWMLTRRSGAAFWLFEDGALVSALQAGP